MAEDISDAEKSPDPHPDHPDYVVGDYLNLDITIHPQMHVEEASVVYSHEDDDTIEITITGKPEPKENDTDPLTRRVRVSRKITLEDVPGVYELSRVEILTASARSLTHDYERRPAFEIMPEPDLWNVTMHLDQQKREPLFPTDEDANY